MNPVVLGLAEKRYEFEDGLVVVYREPSSKEVVDYNNSIYFRRRGKSYSTNLGEPQLALADKIIVDLENTVFVDAEGKQRPLNKSTKASELAHLKLGEEGRAPKSWKELLPAARKSQFISAVMGGMEEEEKNS